MSLDGWVKLLLTGRIDDVDVRAVPVDVRRRGLDGDASEQIDKSKELEALTSFNQLLSANKTVKRGAPKIKLHLTS